MKTLTLFLAFALAAAVPARAQSDTQSDARARTVKRPLLAASHDPRHEQIRQEAIRAQQTRLHTAEPKRGGRPARRPRVRYAYRAPVIHTGAEQAPAQGQP